MLFHTWTFLVFAALFFAGLAVLQPRPGATRNWILLGSLVFYGWWYPPFLLLIVVNGLVDFFAAGRIVRSDHGAVRRIWLTASLVANLGMLAVFKYADFALQSLEAALSLDSGTRFNVILPIGISFYTFQSMSYTIDVYRGRLRPASSLRDYFLFISFFPQLVAGPIVRASEFLPQLMGPIRLRAANLAAGLWLFLIGLAKKLVVAGTLAPIVELYFQPERSLTPAQAWVGALAFAGQIYADFSGYTDMARGLARMIGFELPINFNLPYLARGFSDFWQRWHISLSRWLRDYLYVCLGGNRRGRVRTLANLMLTMLLGGLWHGAAWTFVLWGGLHGTYLILERVSGSLVTRSARLNTLRAESRVWDVLARAITFAAVVLAWVPFRAASLEHTLSYWRTMFESWPTPQPGLGVTLLVVPLLVQALPGLAARLRLDGLFLDPRWRVAVSPLLVWAVIVFGGIGGEFIYFQF